MSDSLDTQLEAIRTLLWAADELICGLPTPKARIGEYYDSWGALGEVHSAIGAAYPSKVLQQFKGYKIERTPWT